MLQAIFVAVLAASFTLWVTWLKSHREEMRKNAEYFLTIVVEAADLASEYWLLPGSDPKCALHAVRLVGFQQRLSRLRITVSSSFSEGDRELLTNELQEFFDACTGGNHGDPDRLANVDRARSAQSVAAILDDHVMSSLERASRISSYIGRRFPSMR
jgi:hypothetical protein